MSIIACPHCRKSIKIGAVDAPSGSDTPLGSEEVRAVFEFIRTFGPKRETSAGLFETYELLAGDYDYPTISKNAFARALRMHGATPWRNATGRGWELPDLRGEAARPSKPARSVREEEARSAQRNFELSPPPAAKPAPPGGLMGDGERRALSPSGKPYTTSYFIGSEEIYVDKPQWVVDEEFEASIPEYVPEPGRWGQMGDAL